VTALICFVARSHGYTQSTPTGGQDLTSWLKLLCTGQTMPVPSAILLPCPLNPSFLKKDICQKHSPSPLYNTNIEPSQILSK
jgi:hypothetical protein